MGIFTREQEKVPCTVEISHKFESLHAHVRFNNGAVVHPGDEVLVEELEVHVTRDRFDQETRRGLEGEITSGEAEKLLVQAENKREGWPVSSFRSGRV